MNEHNVTDLPLEERPTRELEALLRAETGKEAPDDDLVLQLLHLLEERNSGEDEPLNPGEKAAWEAYRKRVRRRAGKPVLRSTLVKAASVVLIAGVLMATFATRANAGNLWDRFILWTDSYFSFFHPDAMDPAEEDYLFQTNNEGLQEVYNAVVALGITEPVVPMWLPEGYELTQCTTFETPQKNYVVANFADESSEHFVVLNYVKNFTGRTNQYPKDAEKVTTIEMYGESFDALRNDTLWTIIWSGENTENSIIVDCQEDTLNKILESIYVWRNN